MIRRARQSSDVAPGTARGAVGETNETDAGRKAAPGPVLTPWGKMNRVTEAGEKRKRPGRLSRMSGWTAGLASAERMHVLLFQAKAFRKEAALMRLCL